MRHRRQQHLRAAIRIALARSLARLGGWPCASRPTFRRSCSPRKPRRFPSEWKHSKPISIPPPKAVLRRAATEVRPHLRETDIRGTITEVAQLRIFLSYSSQDQFEAALLQEWLETRFGSDGVSVWTYERDQARDQSNVSRRLKETVQESFAVVFLLSPFTIEGGAAQWVELGYADAFSIPTFILLHHVTYGEVMRAERNVPPLVRQSQCTPAIEWKSMEKDLRNRLDLVRQHETKGGPE